MAVTQRFTVELPVEPFLDEEDGWLLTLTRAEVETLHGELGEALGAGRVRTWPDDPLTFMPEMDEGALPPSENVDEVLARLQVQAAGPPGTSPSWPARAGMSPQSGIGNLPS